MLPLAADRRLVGVARQDTAVVRHRHVDLEHRALDLLEVAAADRVLEERVAGEGRLVVDDEADHVVRVTRRRDRLDHQLAHLERAALDGEAELAFVRDVVGVRVRAQHVRRRHAPLLGGPQERLERCSRIDEDGGSAGLVGDEVGVRQPPVVHAPRYQHADRLTGPHDPRS